MNFIQANDKFVNLTHVSSITLLHNRLALDMNCPVEVDNKIISYYAYMDWTDKQDETDILNNSYVQAMFIKHEKVLININHITSIKFVSEKMRIIFNLSHSTTSTNYSGKKRLTSKFIYFDCNNTKEYNDLVTKTKQYTNIKGK